MSKLSKPTVLELPYQKEAWNLYNNMLNEVERKKRTRENTDDIKFFITQSIRDIKQTLNEGRTEAIRNIDLELESIRRSYETEREYTNPQQELLQRQDFDLKLSNMEDTEFIDYVHNRIDNGNRMENYEFQRVKASSKERGLQDRLRTKLAFYAEETCQGQEYRLTEEYQEKEQLREDIQVLSTDFLWDYSVLDGEMSMTPYQDSMNGALDGYDVNVQ